MHCYEQRNQSQRQQVQPSYVRMGLVEASAKCRPKHDHVEQVNQTLDGSSAPMRREYPDTSAARIAVRRTGGICRARWSIGLTKSSAKPAAALYPSKGGDLPTPGRGTQSRVRMLAK